MSFGILPFISLMINNVKILFVYLLAISISSGKCLFMAFVLFFFLLSCSYSLYSLDITPIHLAWKYYPEDIFTQQTRGLE